jgi:hypothetical protein
MFGCQQALKNYFPPIKARARISLSHPLQIPSDSLTAMLLAKIDCVAAMISVLPTTERASIDVGLRRAAAGS